MPILILVGPSRLHGVQPPPAAPPGGGGGGILGLKRTNMPTGMTHSALTGTPSGTPGSMSIAMPAFTGTPINVSTKAQLDSAVGTVSHLGIIDITADITSWTGTTTLPDRGSGFRAQIRHSGHATLPAWSDNYLTANKATNRVVRGTTNLRKITQNSTNAPVFRFATGADGWWLTGLEITSGSSVTQQQGLVEIKGSTGHGSVADMPHNITLDRCAITSWDPTSTTVSTVNHNVARAVQADGFNVLMVHCDLDIGFHPFGADSQAFLCVAGAENVLAFNCHLRGGSECVLIGGGTCSITDHDHNNIAIIRCLVDKHPSWPTTQQKNCIEAKHVVRWYNWGCVYQDFQGTSAQFYALLTNCSDQNGSNPWAKVRDWTVWASRAYNLRGGTYDFAMRGSGPNPNQGTERVELGHLAAPELTGGGGFTSGLILANSGVTANDVAIHHSLFDHAHSYAYWNNPTNYGASRGYINSHNINRNALGFGPYFADGGSTNSTLLNAVFDEAPGGQWNGSKNLKLTGGSNWDATLITAGCGSFAAEADVFTDPVAGDFTAKTGGLADGTGDDGEDLGPDWTLVNAATAGVR